MNNKPSKSYRNVRALITDRLTIYQRNDVNSTKYYARCIFPPSKGYKVFSTKVSNPTDAANIALAEYKKMEHERNIPTKVCSRCGQAKALFEFYKHEETADGRYAACKACRKAWQRDYQKRNNERITEVHRKYRKEKLEAGIYTITNRANGKIYVGQSSMLKRRLSRHKSNLKNLVHENDALQEDYIKHGDIFTYEVVEELPPHTDTKILLQKESLLIQSYVKKGAEVYNLVMTIT